MKTLILAVIITVLTGCTPPGETPFTWYGCAPRAARELLQYWHAQGLPTPLDSLSVGAVEAELAKAMGTDPVTGYTWSLRIPQGIGEVCPSLSVWLAEQDTVAYLYQPYPFVLVNHTTDHVSFQMAPNDTVPAGYWAVVVAEPNWR